ncbi:calcyphosin-like protein [Amphiura filiformis]|uniref:calcyphosin-like protein n=1 Tax=Amphiura filiformis TaxID=82378 RepID=UPI003B22594D
MSSPRGRPMSSQSRDEENMKRQHLRAAASAKDPIEKCRSLALSRGTTAIYKIGKVFKIFDDDNSGSLNEAEFKKGLTEWGRQIEDENQRLTDEQLDEVFKTFDKDGSGTISYNEFLRALRGPMSSSRKNLIDLAFKKLDKTGDGKITLKDVKGVYNTRRHPEVLSGEKTEDEVLIKFLNTFESDANSPDVEPTGDGEVTKDEFENYYAGVSASVDEDIYFDLVMRTAWNL